MAKLRLDHVRKEVAGFWDSAQVAVWIRAAESAFAQGEWSRATKRLFSLSEVLDAVATGSPALRELAASTLEVAVRTDDPALVRDAGARVLGRGWTAGEMPDALQGALEVAHQTGADRAGEALGALLESRFPHWPHGPYASADFRERLARRKGTRPPDAEGCAARFLRAAALFENRGDAAAAAHCRLRAAALFADYTAQSERARELARSLDPTTLSGEERLWLAHVQAKSPFWLDRVRAADFIGDVLDGLHRGDPAFDGWSGDVPRAVGRRLFAALPANPQDAEVDRLESFLERVEGPERWELEAQLRGRISVAELASAALDDCDPQRARELERDALPLHGFAAIVEAWRGESVGVLPTDDVTRGVVEGLVSLQRDEAARGSALAALVDAVLHTSDAAALRPLAVLFPRLLAREMDPSEEAAVTQIALHYIRRGPAPSYGFWALAANLFGAGLPRVGAAAVERALSAGEASPGYGADLVARAIQWAVGEGDDELMLKWLGVGHQLSDGNST